MRNIELKIDGEVIVLTARQTAQLKRAVEKETSVPHPKSCGCLLISCNPAGKSTTHPLVVSSITKLSKDKFSGSYTSIARYGYDFSLSDVKMLITTLKEFSAQIWQTAAAELKKV